MLKLIDLIKKAEANKIALAHFNISESEQLKAIEIVGRKLNVPIIVGLSEKERDYWDIYEFRALVSSINTRYGKEDGFYLYLNADHTHSFEKLVEAIKLGFQSVVFDGSNLSLDENIKLTKQAVNIARHLNENVLVEGELGYLGKGSEILNSVPVEILLKEHLTDPDVAYKFVLETEVDLLAPAVGSFHGVVKGFTPQLDIERIKKIKEKVKIPLVLHGGSGLKDQDFLNAIDAGISIIHIATELRMVWRDALKDVLEKNKQEISPYKLMPEVIEKLVDLIEKRVRLFMKL